MARLNFNHLFGFYSVATAGSIKNAAINLGLSSSTLSEQMKSLERSTGGPLFVRVGRSLSLSSRGQRLFSRVESIFEQADSIAGALDTDSERPLKRIEIGITTTISRTFAYEIFRPLFKTSGSHVRVTESQAENLLMDFKHQKLDILITHERLSSSLVRRLETLVIREPRFVVVAGREWARRVHRFPTGLSGRPFFLFTVRTPIRWEIERFFKTHTIVADIRGEIDDPEILKAAAMDDLGLTILPEHAILPADERRLVRLGVLPSSDVRIYAYHLGGDPCPELERVVATLKQGLARSPRR